MATTRGRVYAAKDSFVLTEDGVGRRVEKGLLVREGHALLKGREHLFELHQSKILEPEE